MNKPSWNTTLVIGGIYIGTIIGFILLLIWFLGG